METTVWTFCNFLTLFRVAVLELELGYGGSQCSVLTRVAQHTLMCVRRPGVDGAVCIRDGLTSEEK